MRKGILTIFMAVLTAQLATAPAEAQGGCGGQGALRIVGLTDDQRLICFTENGAAQADDIGAVRNLTGDTRLVGIDFRPATGELYGLGDQGGLYVLDTRSGRATFRSKLSAPLSGGSFGIDFNPTVDRLRIVGDTGQNLRVNVDTGAVTADTGLTYTSPTAASGITGAAYTNNDGNASTGTTLFVIDSTQDQLVIQAPPNAGSLNATGKLTVDASGDVGFDIYSEVKGGATVDVHAFLSLRSGDRTRFYKVNLFTGKAAARGSFRSRDQVIDIAIPVRQ